MTQYQSIIDPSETWLEKWLLHKATEVYNYYGCVRVETNPRVKALWEKFLDYKLGQFHEVARIFKEGENRDPREVVPETLPEPIAYESQRDFVRQTLRQEVDLRAKGTGFVDKSEEGLASKIYRERLHGKGVPSEIAALGYWWTPGGELNLQSTVPVHKFEKLQGEARV